MTKAIHIVYVIFLVWVALLSTVIIGAKGYGYYTTSMEERPFHPQYETLKPTGYYGHAYGIFGSLMITFGVVLYSSRKRLRMLAGVGKIKYFLEFHIFLCLVGPILVLYHTTFKFGGLVAVSFWSMTAVVLSGLIGRYFYVQIPKGIHGNELTVAELTAENEKLRETLQKQFGLGSDLLRKIDAIAMPSRSVAQLSLFQVLEFFIVNDLTRRARLRMLSSQIGQHTAHPQAVKRMHSIVSRRIALTRRIAFLEKFKQIFHYWHVVHLPFSIVMFIILFIHVGVAIAFGYTWTW